VENGQYDGYQKSKLITSVNLTEGVLLQKVPLGMQTIEKKMDKKILFKQGLWILLVGTALYSVDYLIKKNVQSINSEDLAVVSGTVNTLKQERYDRSIFYVFTLKEYPKDLFKVDFGYGNLLKNRLETMPMDSFTPVNLRISKEDYDFKIAKTQKRDRRIFNRNSPYIEVYALIQPSNNFVYLSLEEYKTLYASKGGNYARFFGFSLILLGVFTLLKLVFQSFRQYSKTE
jgi:hypothetical protein